VLKLKTGIEKRTRLGLTLEQSAREILAHLGSETKLLHGVWCCRTRWT
jgi:hypothetical protein